jgi:hypothetical protein
MSRTKRTPSTLVELQLLAGDLRAALKDRDQQVTAQKERIDILEFNLEKLRALIWHGYMQTAGALPFKPEPDSKPEPLKPPKKAKP